MNSDSEYTKWIIGGRYEVLSKLGEGTSSVVYKAHDIKQKRQVAIKMLNEKTASNESLVVRFIKESKAFASLKHPNIISIYDVVFEGPELPYIVMELAEGCNLKSYIIKKGGRLSTKETVDFSLQIASALKCIHDADIIHRDVKPENAVFTSEGVIKLTDFGVAILSDDDKSVSKTTSGTPLYMSPEQIGRSSVDLRTDIYALGVTMFEMICGRTPFYARDMAEVFGKHNFESPDKATDVNPECPIGLSEIIEKCIRKNPDERFDDCGDLIEYLLALKNDIKTVFGFAYDDLGINDTGALSERTLVDNFAPEEPVKRVQKKASFFLKNESKKRNVNIIPIITASIFIFFTVLLTIVFVFMQSGKNEGSTELSNQFSKDNFIGLNYTPELLKRISSLGYTCEVKFDSSDEYDACIVKNQSLNRDNKTLSLTVTAPINSEVVPFLFGEELVWAETVLKQMGIKYEICEKHSDEVSQGNIIGTYPNYGFTVSDGELLVLYVSSGTEVEYTAVPSVVGFSLDTASKILSDAGLEIGSTRFVFSNDHAIGEVITQGRIEGERVAIGYTSVDLIISLGNNISA